MLFFLKRLNKEGIEATAADPSRASAAHSALTQTTADASPPSHSVWTLSLGTATTSRQVHREGEQRQKSFLFSPRTITSFHCQSYAMIQSESGEEQNRKFYHQMREKGLQYSFMDTCVHLYVSWIHSPAGSYGDTDHSRESLPLGICTIASVIMEVTHVNDEVNRYRVYTYICPHV